MKVAIGTDHGAINYKNQIIKYLEEKNCDVYDCGTNSEESCDYPDFAYKLAQKVTKGDVDWGILMCGTGIGMSLAANKVKGIRAAVTPNVDFARLAKQHNNANIICLSGRFMTVEDCKNCIDAYMESEFEGNLNNDSGKRHMRRVNKITEIENEFFK